MSQDDLKGCTTQLRIPMEPELRTKLEDLAAKEGQSLVGFVREALLAAARKQLEDKEPPCPPPQS